jgi:hypothetical protein
MEIPFFEFDGLLKFLAISELNVCESFRSVCFLVFGNEDLCDCAKALLLEKALDIFFLALKG